MLPNDARLNVSEIFGPTIQGEGPSAGRQAVFLRLSGCNLACSWCDTPYTWDWTKFDRSQENTTMSIRDVRNDIMTRALSTDAKLLVITGGEPMLQQNGILALLQILPRQFGRIEFETNGTVTPMLRIRDWPNVYFNVSPKLANSGQAHPMSRELHPGWHGVENASFKFVCEDPKDFEEIEQFDLPRYKVWIMPQGQTEVDVLWRLKKLSEPAIKRGWNVSSRNHVFIWGQKRGV